MEVLIQFIITFYNKNTHTLLFDNYYSTITPGIMYKFLDLKIIIQTWVFTLSFKYLGILHH